MIFEGEPEFAEDLVSPTGAVFADGRIIEIHNGTPALEALVWWAASRFAEAGLVFPPVSTITFTHYSDFCDDVHGRSIWSETSIDLFLCWTESQVCLDADCKVRSTPARRTVLHELAHAWMITNLDDDTRGEFTELVGLESWDGSETEWEAKAREHAADTIAWGLFDAPLEIIICRVGHEELTERFELLTGVAPISPSRTTVS